jgi:hypothetical protein
MRAGVWRAIDCGAPAARRHNNPIGADRADELTILRYSLLRYGLPKQDVTSDA